MKKKPDVNKKVKNDQSDKDDFADKINDFLQSVNHLNKSGNNHICEKCGAKFASKDFLDIHIGATHKIKCKECEFETGHKNSMMEHKANPGIWHRK